MNAKPMLCLEARELVVAYDRREALDLSALDLSGNTVAVIGHNGAGKSTMMKALLHLLPLQHGTLRAFQQVGEKKQLLTPARHMAFCPESGAVFSDISVENYIRLWCRLKQGDSDYYRGRGSECIARLEIEPLLPRLGRELSKGQRRRVQTAIGFLTDPRLFLLDEPFDGLDIQKSHDLSEYFEERSKEMSLLISSHRMDVVERIADAVIVLDHGKLVAAGPTAEVAAALCPHSVHITALSAPDLVLDRLRESFPEALFTKLGGSIVVHARTMNLRALQDLVRAVDRNGAQLSDVSPSLVDAMNLYLRGVKRVG